MTPVVDRLEERHQGQLMVKRINANEGDGPEIMTAYDILGHPTTLIFNRQGEETRRFIGPQPIELVDNAIQEVLK